jgi:hypothetical protein
MSTRLVKLLSILTLLGIASVDARAGKIEVVPDSVDSQFAPIVQAALDQLKNAPPDCFGNRAVLDVVSSILKSTHVVTIVSSALGVNDTHADILANASNPAIGSDSVIRFDLLAMQHSEPYTGEVCTWDVASALLHELVHAEDNALGQRDGQVSATGPKNTEVHSVAVEDVWRRTQHLCQRTSYDGLPIVPLPNLPCPCDLSCAAPQTRVSPLLTSLDEA